MVLSQCGSCLLLQNDASFTGCHSTVNPDPYFTACSDTLCAYPTKDGLRCRFFQAYAEACRLSEASLGDSWRSITTCRELLNYADVHSWEVMVSMLVNLPFMSPCSFHSLKMPDALLQQTRVLRRQLWVEAMLLPGGFCLQIQQHFWSVPMATAAVCVESWWAGPSS